MKKIIAAFMLCAVILTACIQSETSTTINADGSGSMVSTVDLSEMIKMMAGKKAQTETFMLDTTINVRSFSDTAASLTPYQKGLVRDMKVNILMDMRQADQAKFKVSIVTPFKTLEDFNALKELMKRKEYDKLFDNAMKLPMFSDKDKEEQVESDENDNIFGSIFPAFYDCSYTKNSIVCKIDSAKYKESLEAFRKMDMDINGEMESKLLGDAKFTNKLVLPRKAIKISGDSWKQGTTVNELVQSGNLLDLYQHPEKYAYSVQY